MTQQVRTDRIANLRRGDASTISAPLSHFERRTGSAQDQQPEPSYYDISILKAPLWKWEIATYFFLGGLSAGAYALGRIAKRAGGDAFSDITRVAAPIAMGALLPSPPLLIHDLGDPKRFHHMLRVWKPSSPMNLGTWTLVAYSGMVAFEVAGQYLDDVGPSLPPELHRRLKGVLHNSTLLLVHDAAGIPFALLLAGYTGVLLSCTSNPLWCRNPWLGPLFSASAIATGAEAINLALTLTSSDSQSQSQQALNIVDSIAHAVELVANHRMMKSAGKRAMPLTVGSQSHNHRLSVAAIVASEIVKYLPLRGQARRWARAVSSVLGLAGGFAVRWSIVQGGHEAANDPKTARLISEPDASTARQAASNLASGKITASVGEGSAVRSTASGGPHGEPAHTG